MKLRYLVFLAMLGPVGSFGQALAKAPAAKVEVPFIISYWWGVPVAETTLERYQEIADCGFNVAFPACDIWGDEKMDGSPTNDLNNRKFLDMCPGRHEGHV